MCTKVTSLTQYNATIFISASKHNTTNYNNSYPKFNRDCIDCDILAINREAFSELVLNNVVILIRTSSINSFDASNARSGKSGKSIVDIDFFKYFSK